MNDGTLALFAQYESLCRIGMNGHPEYDPVLELTVLQLQNHTSCCYKHGIHNYTAFNVISLLL